MPSRPRNSALSASVAWAALAATAAFAQAPPATAPASAPAVKVEKSTAPSAAAVPSVPQEPKTIGEVYNGAALRDPLVSILGSGGAASVSESDEVSKINIHNLQLRGVLAGRSRLAMIEDASSGARFLLKDDGKLYDTKGRGVPGVTGAIKTSTSVLITTPADNDVQWLKLGEQSSK